MLSPTPQPPATKAILGTREMLVIDVPSVNDLLDKRYPHFTYAKRYEESFAEPLFVM